jgi:hypothetical protein
MKKFLEQKARLIQWIVAIILSAAALRLHFVCLANAGGLWRDEAGGVRLATLPSLGKIWAVFTHDSFPLLMPMLIRAWSSMGFGETDLGLRCFGFGMGLLLLASLWFAANLLQRGVPIVALALVGLDVMVISTGDSLRAYGLGTALDIVTLAFIWRLAQKPDFTNTLLAALSAVLSVQCLYQNCFFVLAACCGGAAVCIAKNRARDIVRIFSAGALAAVSMVPYAGRVVEAQAWLMIQKTGFDFQSGWWKFLEAANSPTPAFKWLWLALFLAAAMIAVLAAASSLDKSVSDFTGRRYLILFCGVAMIAGVAGFVFFLRAANMPTAPWYFMPLIGFVAVCLDAILAQSEKWIQSVIAVVVGLAALITISADAEALKCRQTNVDLIAAQLTARADAQDFIIVQPWFDGVSFARYYKGAASWNTLPPLAEHDIHRYDYLKAEMQKTNAIEPTIDQIAATLQSGHRVWTVTAVADVGGTVIPPPGSEPQTYLPLPPLKYSGWADTHYTLVWESQAMDFIANHSRRFEHVRIVVNQPVNHNENLRLLVAEGWTTNSAAPSQISQ